MSLNEPVEQSNFVSSQEEAAARRRQQEYYLSYKDVIQLCKGIPLSVLEQRTSRGGADTLRPGVVGQRCNNTQIGGDRSTHETRAS